MDEPTKVRNAVLLLWASLLLGTLGTFAASTSEDDIEWAGWVVFAIGYGVNGYLIYKISKQKNWARIALLVLTVLAAAAMLVAWAVWPEVMGGDPWWSDLLFGVTMIADIVAMVWLFSDAGNAWFKPMEA
jgi:surface polysaccharide O-acyltransferase-like enzyme